MTEPLNALDIITREVTARVLGDVEARIAGAVIAAQADAQRRIDELINAGTAVIPELLSTEEVTNPQDSSQDAKSRAVRTGVQGGIATVLVSGALAFAGALNGGVDLTSSGDWKVIAGTVSGAVIMAGAAYIQRIINPPRS